MNVLKRLKSSKCEGTRTLINKIGDNWTLTENCIRTDLEVYNNLMGLPHSEAALLWPIMGNVVTMCEFAEVDEEDQRIAVAQYLYGLWTVRAVVKHLTDPQWRLVYKYLEAHFWYAVAAYRGCTAEAARKQLKIKLELAPLSLYEFVNLIE